jgi:threonine/homoserine efflux transporter RhtA
MSRAPSPREVSRIEEQLQRFGTAMLFCFTGAVLLCVFIVNTRSRLTAGTLQQLASLGVALWLAGMVLLPFVAYYRALRRLTSR